MAKRKHKKSPPPVAPGPSAPLQREPAKLIKRSDAVWLVALGTVLLTASRFVLPDITVTDPQLVGLLISIEVSLIVSRAVFMRVRDKRAKRGIHG